MSTSTEERFMLRPWKRGPVGGVVIEREVRDHAFDPPIWVVAEEMGRFPNREAARTYMLGRSVAS